MYECEEYAWCTLPRNHLGPHGQRCKSHWNVALYCALPAGHAGQHEHWDEESGDVLAAWGDVLGPRTSRFRG